MVTITTKQNVTRFLGILRIESAIKLKKLKLHRDVPKTSSVHNV